MAKMQKKNLDTSPDEVRKFDNGKIELATLGDVTIGRAGTWNQVGVGRNASNL